MGQFVTEDGDTVSSDRLASSVSLSSASNAGSVDDDIYQRQSDLLNYQIEALYAASIAMSKAATILNKLGIPSWV